jgi:hypothetical protein
MGDRPETYEMLLKVRLEATKPPEQTIPDLKRLLKALLRSFGFKCVDVRQIPFPRPGEALGAPEETKHAL